MASSKLSPAHKQIIGGIIFLVISSLYGWEARKISLFYTREGQIFTARTIPYTLSLLGIAFSLLYLLFPIFQLISTARRRQPAPVDENIGEGNWKPVLYLLILMLAYVAAFSFLGFLLSTVGFLVGGFFILGQRRWLPLMLVSVGVVLVFWLLVSVLLNIYLLEGTLWNIFR